MSNPEPRVAFVCWNPFQYLHFAPMAAELPGAVFVIEARGKHRFAFGDDVLTQSPTPVVFWEPDRIHELDDAFDVVVCQTVFKDLPRLRRSRIAMLQYGYAKEPHNYGDWRSLADVTLAYGPYAQRRLAAKAPSVSVGVPRFDRWHPGSAARPGGARTRRPRLLYLPTWGALSSFERYYSALGSLAADYDVRIKLHHNTWLLEKNRVERLVAEGFTSLGPTEDTIEAIVEADLVLSDYSGAIFDAVYFAKPLVLLHHRVPPMHEPKFAPDSLEYARRAELGTVVTEPERLSEAIANRLQASSGAMHPMFDELFVPGPGASARAAEAIRALHAGAYRRSPDQEQLRARTLVRLEQQARERSHRRLPPLVRQFLKRAAR